MPLKTYIIIGRSGSGKGTQADLLQKYIKRQSPEADILYVESGDEFREFLKRILMQADRKRSQYKGKLQPAFLAIWVWANYFIKNLNDKNI